MVILIEGPKNVGKTYLLEHSIYHTYKFPFISYYKKMMADEPGATGNASKETFHFSTSYDITLLSLLKNGGLLFLGNLLVDRSFLSNLVLGELQSRITHEEGIKYLDYLASEGYLKYAKVIYIDKFSAASGRSTNKDDWEFLGYEEQKQKYEQYFKYLKDKYQWEPTRFINNMKADDVDKFNTAIKNMEVTNAKTQLKKTIGNFIDKLMD